MTVIRQYQPQATAVKELVEVLYALFIDGSAEGAAKHISATPDPDQRPCFSAPPE